MCGEGPTLCQTCVGEPLTVKRLLFYCQNHIIETKKNLFDNLSEALSGLSPTEDNINKIIIFLKLTEVYNLL